MKILYATDGSEYSEGAARFLTRLNLTADDEIILMHVITWVPFEDDMASYYASLQHIKKDIAPKIFDSALNILKPVNAKISTILDEGMPDRIIINAASEANADLIVMGAKGIKGIKSLFIGSVTRAVAINSLKPVLAIKHPQWEGSKRLKILFATDGSDYSNFAGQCLAQIPFDSDSEINILNVIRPAYSDIPERFAIEVDERIKEEVAKARTAELAAAEKLIEKSCEYIKKRFSKINRLIQVGDPSIEILNAAEKIGIDIIVVGSRGLRGIMGMIGSVSKNILNQSDCSVLIGKK